jgi:flagellar biosynthesis/type III secretory pathway chaperone
VGANELSALLWREREMLELLSFKLEEEQLLLTAGRSRWVQHATREVEQVLQRLRSTGLARSVEAASLAREWGVDEDAPLRELVAHAPAGPWSDIFSGHLQAITQLTAQIKGLRDENEQFLRAAARSTQETLAGVTLDPTTYDSTGASGGVMSGSRLVDRTL